MIARWDIRVNLAYEGLLWVGGPQVDPGYVGHLFCPIYNLSDKEVTLRLGDTIAIIDFIKTTPFAKGNCIEYPRPPKNLVFGDYNPEKLKSALYTEARKRIDGIENRVNAFVTDIENKVSAFGQRLDTSVGIVFAAIAVLVAALSIFVGSGEAVRVTVPWWFYLGISFSIVSLVLSIFAYTKTRSTRTQCGATDDIAVRVGKIEKRMKWFAAAIWVAFVVTVIVVASLVRSGVHWPF